MLFINPTLRSVVFPFGVHAVIAVHHFPKKDDEFQTATSAMGLEKDQPMLVWSLAKQKYVRARFQMAYSGGLECSVKSESSMDSDVPDFLREFSAYFDRGNPPKTIPSQTETNLLRRAARLEKARLETERLKAERLHEQEILHAEKLEAKKRKEAEDAAIPDEIHFSEKVNKNEYPNAKKNLNKLPFISSVDDGHNIVFTFLYYDGMMGDAKKIKCMIKLRKKMKKKMIQLRDVMKKCIIAKTPGRFKRWFGGCVTVTEAEALALRINIISNLMDELKFENRSDDRHAVLKTMLKTGLF